MSVELVETVCANALVVLFVCINSLPRRIRLFRRSYVREAVKVDGMFFWENVLVLVCLCVRECDIVSIEQLGAIDMYM